MSPNLRRAFHQALDIVLDALEDEGEVEKPKRKRGPATPKLPDIGLTDEERAQALADWAKKGWRKAG